MITFEEIRKFAESLPGAEAGSSYGTPAIKVGKKLVLRMHQEEDAIVILLDSVEEQQDLIKSDPEHFYITPHYDGHAAVLVRSSIESDVFQEVLESAWRRVATRKHRKRWEEMKGQGF